MIAVTTTPSGHGREYTWSASLIYADRKDGHGFRWYEVAFFNCFGRNGGRRDEPYALELHEQDFFHALSPAMHTVAIAYGPLPIDGEDEPKFIERWLELVAKAATGQLVRPNSMPVQALGSDDRDEKKTTILDID